MTDDAARTELPQVASRRWVRVVRIGTSVFFGMVTLVLVVMWVRSYWHHDVVFVCLPASHAFTVGSGYGIVWTGLGAVTNPPPSHIHSNEFDADERELWQNRGFDFDNSNGLYVQVPHWFSIILMASLSSLTWLGSFTQFSLRTMLIATTLLAVSLGAMAWAAAG